MRALVVFCHPSPESYSRAVLDTVVDRLRAGGAEVRLIDLYAEGFDPVMSRSCWEGYEDCPGNARLVRGHADAVKAADTLVFVYPTWWYGPPAMLKGWLERVLIPDVAFTNPADGPIRPMLSNIRDLAVFTTCGATWWLTRLVGSPGRRTLLRGLRLNCHPRARSWFAAHYDMDRSTPESRARHLRKVARLADRLAARRRRGRVEAEEAAAA